MIIFKTVVFAFIFLFICIAVTLGGANARLNPIGLSHPIILKTSEIQSNTLDIFTVSRPQLAIPPMQDDLARDVLERSYVGFCIQVIQIDPVSTSSNINFWF
jgi:hypothetical protein